MFSPAINHIELNPEDIEFNTAKILNISRDELDEYRRIIKKQQPTKEEVDKINNHNLSVYKSNIKQPTDDELTFIHQRLHELNKCTECKYEAAFMVFDNRVKPKEYDALITYMLMGIEEMWPDKVELWEEFIALTEYRLKDIKDKDMYELCIKIHSFPLLIIYDYIGAIASIFVHARYGRIQSIGYLQKNNKAFIGVIRPEPTDMSNELRAYYLEHRSYGYPAYVATHR